MNTCCMDSSSRNILCHFGVKSPAIDEYLVNDSHWKVERLVVQFICNMGCIFCICSGCINHIELRSLVQIHAPIPSLPLVHIQLFFFI